MKKLTFDEFLNRARAKFGNRFDYSMSKYSGINNRMQIICPLHGVFWQTPNTHLGKGMCGCPTCRLETLSEKNKNRDYSNRIYKLSSAEEYMTKCEAKYGNKFKINLDNFCGIMMDDTIIVECPIHGPFEILPKYFISKSNKNGCGKCSLDASSKKRKYSYNEMIRVCDTIFGGKYTYPEHNATHYKTKSSVIDIICPIHGLFNKSMQSHTDGIGCYKCKVTEMCLNNSKIGSYSKDMFNNNHEIGKLPAVLYYLNINNGKYYKIGISRTSVYNRIKSLKSQAKKFNEILDFEIIDTLQMNLYECFHAEQNILERFKEHRVFRHWSTELFGKNILGEGIETLSNLLQGPVL